MCHYFAEKLGTTLFAEADTRLFQANDSDASHLFIEEVKIFFNGDNGTKRYFSVDTETARGVIQLSDESSEASLFTLVTTPELHEAGQFQIAYNMDNTTMDASIILMLLDASDPAANNIRGPFELVVNNEQGVFEYNIRGKSTTLPGLSS